MPNFEETKQITITLMVGGQVQPLISPAQAPCSRVHPLSHLLVSMSNILFRPAKGRGAANFFP